MTLDEDAGILNARSIFDCKDIARIMIWIYIKYYSQIHSEMSPASTLNCLYTVGFTDAETET